jgi:hypothetical protein
VIYQFSCEHHMRDEVRMDHAANWKIYDLQTEEENPEGADAVAVELELECPANFVPASVRQTGMRGAWNGEREEAHCRADREPAAAD